MSPTRAVPWRIAAMTLLGLLLQSSPAGAAQGDVIRVGSKSFTESYIVAEMAARLIEEVGEARVERAVGLGGTGVAFGALEAGAIDLYPEYTGTLSHVILKDRSLDTAEAIRVRLEARGLTMSGPLGFANTYALAVRDETAARLGLKTIGDLARHPGLTGGFSSGLPGARGRVAGARAPIRRGAGAGGRHGARPDLSRAGQR